MEKHPLKEKDHPVKTARPGLNQAKNIGLLAKRCHLRSRNCKRGKERDKRKMIKKIKSIKYTARTTIIQLLQNQARKISMEAKVRVKVRTKIKAIVKAEVKIKGTPIVKVKAKTKEQQTAIARVKEKIKKLMKTAGAKVKLKIEMAVIAKAKLKIEMAAIAKRKINQHIEVRVKVEVNLKMEEEVILKIIKKKTPKILTKITKKEGIVSQLVQAKKVVEVQANQKAEIHYVEIAKEDSLKTTNATNEVNKEANQAKNQEEDHLKAETAKVKPKIINQRTIRKITEKVIQQDIPEMAKASTQSKGTVQVRAKIRRDIPKN